MRIAIACCVVALIAQRVLSFHVSIGRVINAAKPSNSLTRSCDHVGVLTVAVQDTTITDTSNEVQQSLREAYPEALRGQDDFMSVIGMGAECLMDDERQLLIAKTFAHWPRTLLLARGPDALSSDFVYYSPSTGILNKIDFMKMVKTLDIAFGIWRIFSQGYKLHGNGVVSWVGSYTTTNDGPMVTAKGTGKCADKDIISDQELNVIVMDSAGRVRALANGVWAAASDVMKNPATLKRLDEVIKKLESRKLKLDGLKGQERTKSFMMTADDISSLEDEKTRLEARLVVKSNVGGRAGLEGVFYALGMSQPTLDDVRAMIQEGTTAEGNVYVPREGFVNVPADVQKYSCVGHKDKKGTWVDPSRG